MPRHLTTSVDDTITATHTYTGAIVATNQAVVSGGQIDNVPVGGVSPSSVYCTYAYVTSSSGDAIMGLDSGAGASATIAFLEEGTTKWRWLNNGGNDDLELWDHANNASVARIQANNAGVSFDAPLGFKKVYNAATYGSGMTDVEIQAAIDHCEADGGYGVVYLHGGVWTLSTGISITKNSITLMGAGKLNTYLSRAGGSGHTVTLENETEGNYITAVSLQGMTIRSTDTMTSGAAHIYIVDGDHVVLRDIMLDRGYTGIEATSMGNSTLDNVWIKNDSIDYGATTSTSSGIWIGNTGKRNNGNMMLKNVSIGSSTNGYIQYGLVIEAADGWWITNLYTGYMNGTDVYLSPSGSTSLTGLKFNNCWFDPAGDYGLLADGGTTGNYGGLQLANCRFWGWYGGAMTSVTGSATTRSCQYGIYLSPTSSSMEHVNINNCFISDWGRDGIYLADSNLVHSVINGNNICGNSQMSNGTYDAIKVAPEVSFFNIMNNNCGYDMYNSTVASMQRYGIAVQTGDSTGFVIIGNNCLGNQTGGVANNATGTSMVVHNLPE